MPGLSLTLENFPLSSHGLLGHYLVQLRASPEELLVSDLPELSKEGKKEVINIPRNFSLHLGVLGLTFGPTITSRNYWRR